MQLHVFDKSAHVFDFYSLLLKILSKLSNTDIIINFGPAFRFFVEYVRTLIFPFRSRVPPGRCPLFSLCLGVRSLSTIKTMFYKHLYIFGSAQESLFSGLGTCLI